MARIKKLAFPAFAFVAFVIGILSLHRVWESLLGKNSLNDSLASYAKQCGLELTTVIPSESVVVVGHAYGSPGLSESRGNKSISPGLKRFLEENIDSIQLLVLTGDVLKSPSPSKWEKLNDIFPVSRLHITPGNHDVAGNSQISGINSERGIFEEFLLKNSKPTQYPFSIELNDTLYVFDDSTKGDSNRNLMEELHELIVGTDYSNVVVFRHHVLLDKFHEYSNGSGPSEDLMEQEFERLGGMTGGKEVVFIYGDGGAFPWYPRIHCERIGNTKHIINGIGELRDDIVLVINKERIYLYNLKPLGS